MRLLLGAGADPDRPAGDRGTTPLMHAAMGGQVAALRLLSEAGADPLRRDEQGLTASMWAAYRNPQDAMLLAAIAEATVAAKEAAD